MSRNDLIDDLPPKARRFIEHNNEHLIYKAAWLDKDGKSPDGPPATWKKYRAWFKDGTVLTISESEQIAMIATGFMPKWVGI